MAKTIREQLEVTVKVALVYTGPREKALKFIQPRQGIAFAGQNCSGTVDVGRVVKIRKPRKKAKA